MILFRYVVVVVFPDQRFVNGGNVIKKNGVEGLNKQSKRPHHFPKTKLTEDIEILILDLSKTRNIGVRHLQSELLRHYAISLSVVTLL